MTPKSISPQQGTPSSATQQQGQPPQQPGQQNSPGQMQQGGATTKATSFTDWASI
jgi:hypothetical protein